MSVDLEPLDLERDLELLHRWVTHPKAVFWMMQGADLEDVRVAYAELESCDHHDVWLGRVEGEAAFLAETYDPERSPLAGLAELRPGDLGMHVLVAPTDAPRHGFTSRVLAAVVRHCFRNPAVHRVVVEPDVRNDAIAELNARAGFLVEREVELPDKRAALSLCTRERFEQSPLGRMEER